MTPFPPEHDDYDSTPSPEDREVPPGLLDPLDAETPTTSPERLTVEDLTLAELVGQFWRAPGRTLKVLRESGTLSDLRPPVQPQPIESSHERRDLRNELVIGSILLLVIAVTVGTVLTLQAWQGERGLGVIFFAALTVSTVTSAVVGLKSFLGARGAILQRLKTPLSPPLKGWLRFGLWSAAIAVGYIGARMMITGQWRSAGDQLTDGAPFMMAAILIGLVAEFWLGSSLVRAREKPFDAPPLPMWSWSLRELRNLHPIRVAALFLTVILSLVAWQETRDNTFRTIGFYAWAGSIISVVVLFAPKSWSLSQWRGAWRAWNTRRIESTRQRLGNGKINWVVIAFWVIMAVGVVFRVNNFYDTPAQMTSDHKEKIEDAYNVTQGNHMVFFTDNGGREGFQMYAMALFAQLPGMDFNHRTLMLLAVVESVLSLPVMFWLGRQVAGPKQREVGNWLGLIFMGFIAVSYWHLAITRVGLRIILTPLVSALLLGYLIRAMRFNRRQDFIYGGLVLGFGLYMYQAVRVMPLAVLVAVGIAILHHIRNGRAIRRYIVHLAVLVMISSVIFVPLFRFSVDQPEMFWMRSTGRLFGDDLVQTTDAEGNLVLRDATTQERLTAFVDNIPKLLPNIRNSLLMFYWQGDEAWFHGVPYHPEFDPLAGALLVTGLVTCLALYWRNRDPVFLFIPIAVVVMLFPSALSIARANENPSATRSSGAIPPAFLIASMGLLALVYTVRELSRRRGVVVGAGVVAGALLLSLGFNWNLYYNTYHEVYRHTTWPYSIPGDILEGFVLEGNPYGNAFMISYPMWWDYTIIGMEAGIVNWPNGLLTVEDVPKGLSDAYYCKRVTYPLDPDRDLLFLYHHADDATERQLYRWFPTGYSRLIETYNSPSYDFRIFRVPAIGEQALYDFATENVTETVCPPVASTPPEG